MFVSSCSCGLEERPKKKLSPGLALISNQLPDRRVIRSDTRVVLDLLDLGREVDPGGAAVGEHVGVDEGGDLGLALDELQRQALDRVPADVAVQQPDARVVGREAEDQEPAGRQHGHVAPDRVDKVELVDARVRRGRLLAQHVEVVAMEVDAKMDMLAFLSLKGMSVVCCVETYGCGIPMADSMTKYTHSFSSLRMLTCWTAAQELFWSTTCCRVGYSQWV